MHIFAGERFHYNPMKNSVPGVFFGHSPNGWTKVSTIVNGFRESGIYPLNPSAISTAKLKPSLPFSACGRPLSVSKEQSEIESFEKLMKPETITLYNERLEEGYDLETDELYCIWSKLKKTLNI